MWRALPDVISLTCQSPSSPGTAPPPAAMLTFPNNNPMSIFEDGKLKSGTYKVQNLASQTYLEVLDSKELCCRTPTVLTPKDALVIQNTLLTFERSVFLILHSGNLKQWNRGTTRSKRYARPRTLRMGLTVTNAFGWFGARLTMESPTNTATCWEGWHSSLEASSRLRHSRGHGESNSWKTRITGGLDTSGELSVRQFSPRYRSPE